MRSYIIRMVALGCALLLVGTADRSQAGCSHCGGPGVVQYDAGCADCVSCGAPCGHCHHCGGLLSVPVKVVKWALRALGGGCPCGGCGEVYWGPFCAEPRECDGCGNYMGGVPGRYYSGAIEGGVPYGAVEGVPRAGCNCQHSSNMRMSPAGANQHASRQVPREAYPASMAESRTSGRSMQASYTADPRYSSTKRAASAPRYVAGPTPARVEGPQLGTPSTYSTLPPGTTADMFRPRLISVTDRVVKPATAGGSEAPLTAQREEPEIERQ